MEAPKELHKEFNKFPNVTLHTISGRKSITKLLESASKEGSKNYTMMIFAHGLTPKSEKSPESTRVYLPNGTPKIEELGHLINSNLNSKSRLKIMAPFCYSGAIHHISRNRDNTCSIAASDFRTISRSQVDCFGNNCILERSWATSATRLIKNNPNSTLTQIMTMAKGAGDLNDKRGDLSSIDFLKHLYKVKPYAETRNWFTRLFTNYPASTPKMNHLIDLCPEEDNLSTAKEAKLQTLVEKIEEIILEKEMLFNRKMPNVIKNQYKEKLDEYFNFLQDKKHRFFEFLRMASASCQN